MATGFACPSGVGYWQEVLGTTTTTLYVAPGYLSWLDLHDALQFAVFNLGRNSQVRTKIKLGISIEMWSALFAPGGRGWPIASTSSLERVDTRVDLLCTHGWLLVFALSS